MTWACTGGAAFWDVGSAPACSVIIQNYAAGSSRTQFRISHPSGGPASDHIEDNCRTRSGMTWIQAGTTKQMKVGSATGTDSVGPTSTGHWKTRFRVPRPWPRETNLN